MNFKDYQEAAAQYAVYPKGRELEYLVFGLIGEWGELLDARSVWFDSIDDIDEEAGKDSAAKRRTMLETGDVWWYAAMLARHLGMTDAEAYTSECFSEYTTINLARLAQCVKRRIRDGADNNEEMRTLLARVMIDLASWSKSFGGAPFVWQVNIEKLADRQQRNVIKGKGDHR